MFDNFFKQFNGYSLDYDGAYEAQCFDLIQEWNVNWLGGPFLSGDYAYQIFGQHPEFYDSIPNTPDGVPQQGDIVVWGKAYNGFAGHTGVATGKGDTNTFDCFEQNDPTGSVCHTKTYNYNSVTGWLRKKGGVVVDDQIRLDRDRNWNLYTGLGSAVCMALGIAIPSDWLKFNNQDVVNAINNLKNRPTGNPKADALLKAVKDAVS